MKNRVLIVANTAWYIYNFRFNLIKALKSKNISVYVVCPFDGYQEHFRTECDGVFDWKLDGGGKNFIREFISMLCITKIVASIGPEYLFSYTPKGNIYSGLSTLLFNIKFVPNVSGLGVVFSKNGLSAKILKFLYKISFRKAHKIFFQNMEDMKLFFEDRVVFNGTPCERLMGSGVDLDRFFLNKIRPIDGEFVRFVMAARLIKEKGVYDFIEAAKIVKTRYSNSIFSLVGAVDEARSNGVSLNYINSCVESGVIEYLGVSDSMETIYSNNDCVVLPSYYAEGVPRVLIEGGASGCACIASDMPGCRDVVLSGVTGFLCKTMDPNDLANKMIYYIEMSKESKSEMSKNSFIFIRDNFDEKVIIDKYVKLVTG